MIDGGRGKHPAKGPGRNSPGFLHFAGLRYWTASLLPALVGTTLPFWLRPRGFSFQWLGAIGFFIATLRSTQVSRYCRLGSRTGPRPPGRDLASWGLQACASSGGCCFGVHLDSGLTLHKGVPSSIFILYGLSMVFVGVLYVVPPFNFCRRAGGEVVICEGMGWRLLGAYVVQVGDLTRAVYLASGPLVLATALWVWTDELITRMDDEKKGRRTMVILFGPCCSGRLVTLALSVAFYAALFLAAFTSSIPRWSVLLAALLFGLVWRIIAVSWKEYDSSPRMIEARKKAFALHLTTCITVAATSLMAAGRVLAWASS